MPLILKYDFCRKEEKKAVSDENFLIFYQCNILNKRAANPMKWRFSKTV